MFEPSTSEHISARTIYDPITAIAPAADSRTFAIGYSIAPESDVSLLLTVAASSTAPF